MKNGSTTKKKGKGRKKGEDGCGGVLVRSEIFSTGGRKEKTRGLRSTH